MNTYIVKLMINGEICSMSFYAENAQHAINSAQQSYPDADITDVSRETDVMSIIANRAKLSVIASKYL